MTTLLFPTYNYAMQQHDDIELLKEIQSNGARAEQAFRTLYRKYSARIFSYCRRMLPNNGRYYPEDVLQQAFMGFFNAVKNGAIIENVGGFILTSARNICFNELSRTRIPDFSLSDLELPAPQHRSYDNEELLSLTYAAINRLPEEDKELVLLREQLGYSYDEISAITGLSAAAARQRTHRARIVLKEMLAPYINDIEKNSRGNQS